MDAQSTYVKLGLPEALVVPVVLGVLLVGVTPYLAGTDFGPFKFPKIKNEKLLRQLKIIPPLLFVLLVLGFVPFWTPPESRSPAPLYSITFENLSLTAAVRDLDKRAPEVSITLHKDIPSGKVKTRRFSLSLEAATLSEVLDAFCQSAALEIPLEWKRDGRNVVIYPQQKP